MKAAKMIKGLEDLPHEKRLDGVRSFIDGEEKAYGDLITVFQYLEDR